MAFINPAIPDSALAETNALKDPPSLHDEFHECLSTYWSETQAFDLIRELITLCSRQVMSLNAALTGCIAFRDQMGPSRRVATLLRNEQHTWSLLLSLLWTRVHEEAASASLRDQIIQQDGIISDNTMDTAQPISQDTQRTDAHSPSNSSQRSEHSSASTRGLLILRQQSGGVALNATSARRVSEALMNRSVEIREAQQVIDWLEQIARDEANTESIVASAQKDLTEGWAHTRHLLEAQSTSVSVFAGAPGHCVQSLDPDAPIRERRPLADEDRENEERLVRALFRLVRCGCVDEAQQLCIQRGHAWRAATLLGWTLFHDPNLEVMSASDHTTPVEGNWNRALWKRICWKMVEDERFSPYERALYGLLSGHVNSALAVASSWHDALWVLYRCYVDQSHEKELSERLVSLPPAASERRRADRFPLPDNYWKNPLTTRSIFEVLESSKNLDIARQSQDYYHKIQKLIVLDDLTGVVDLVADAIKNDADIHPHIVRFFAHLAHAVRLIVSKLDSTKEEKCDKVIARYIEVLMRDGDFVLVPRYIACLSKPDERLVVLAQLLESLEARLRRRALEPPQEAVSTAAFVDEQLANFLEVRAACVKIAEQLQLDVRGATRLLVERALALPSLAPYVTPAAASAQEDEHISKWNNSVDEEDSKRISTLEWLLLSPDARLDAFVQANALMRYFIGLEKLTCVRETLKAIPADSIETIKRYEEARFGSLRAEAHRVIHEHLCWLALVEAENALECWRFKFFDARPPPLPAEEHAAALCGLSAAPMRLVSSAEPFTVRIAREQRLKEHQLELDRWRHQVGLTAQIAARQVYNVLLFPGGWMKFTNWSMNSSSSAVNADTDEQNGSDEERRRELEALRASHLPRLVLQLIHVLQSAELHAECVQQLAAQLLAAESSGLRRLMTPSQLRSALALLEQSASALAGKQADDGTSGRLTLDAFGFPKI